jgi:hypothetical protein
MKNSVRRFFLFCLVSASAIILACGSSSLRPPAPGCDAFVTPPNTTGTLQSIGVCPAAADAQDYPNGVQFDPNGIYNTSPAFVQPLKTSSWGACQGGVPTNDVVVSSTGLAKCTAGASGVYSVYTSVPTNCTIIGPCGTGCQVSGYAQLTCP